jgi:hypothetical protein
MLKAMKLNHDSSIFLPENQIPATDKKDTVNVTNTQKNDDDIFKKPTTVPSSAYLNSYFHSLPSNENVLHLNQKLKKKKNTKKEKLLLSESTDLFSQFEKFNQSINLQGKNIKEEKTLNDLNLNASCNSCKQTREQTDDSTHSLTDSFEVKLRKYSITKLK